MPHLLKNLKEALINNKYFILPQEFVLKYKLPSNKVEIAHFNDLVKSQEDLQFLLTPRLHINDINNTFNKTRVNKAKNVLQQMLVVHWNFWQMKIVNQNFLLLHGL